MVIIHFCKRKSEESSFNFLRDINVDAQKYLKFNY